MFRIQDILVVYFREERSYCEPFKIQVTHHRGSTCIHQSVLDFDGTMDVAGFANEMKE